MDIIKYINDNLSGILGVTISTLSAVITLIYVLFTYKQMKAAQNTAEIAIKQLRLNNQPCIIFKIEQMYGSPCFSGTRRQLNITIELENIGDSPAISAYTFAYLKLQHSKNSKDGTDIVSMDYIPDYEKGIKAGGKATASIRFETSQINMLVEDLKCTQSQGQFENTKY